MSKSHKSKSWPLYPEIQVPSHKTGTRFTNDFARNSNSMGNGSCCNSTVGFKMLTNFLRCTTFHPVSLQYLILEDRKPRYQPNLNQSLQSKNWLVSCSHHRPAQTTQVRCGESVHLMWLRRRPSQWPSRQSREVHTPSHMTNWPDWTLDWRGPLFSAISHLSG